MSRYSELLHLEHIAQQAEATALANLRSAESGLDTKLVAFVDALRERYQQEQMFAETSRTLATYGTIALLAVNTVLFASNVLLFEPRKLRRTEDRIRGLITESSDDVVRRLLPSPGAVGSSDHQSQPDAAPPAPALPLVPPEVAFVALVQAALADVEQRLEQRLVRIEHLHTHSDVTSTVSSAATGTPPARAALAVTNPVVGGGGDPLKRLHRAWAKVPPGPVFERREEWPLAVLGVAAVGGLVGGVLVSVARG